MNVQEILNIKKQRKARTKDAIRKIVENIHKKIKYHAEMKKESCTYLIPPIVNDIPLYDLDLVIKDIFKILDEEGYIVSAYANGQLDICWNEKLVEQKVKTDAFVLSEEERKLKNITRKAKKVDDRFSFLANPKKMKDPTIKTIDEQIDAQLEKILKEKDNTQKKYKSIVGNFNKL
jgi:hypothetical protein